MKGERASHEGACWVIIHRKNQILASLTECAGHIFCFSSRRNCTCVFCHRCLFTQPENPLLWHLFLIALHVSCLLLRMSWSPSKGFIPYFNNSIFLGYSIVINNSECWCSLNMVWLGGPDKAYLPTCLLAMGFFISGIVQGRPWDVVSSYHWSLDIQGLTSGPSTEF